MLKLTNKFQVLLYENMSTFKQILNPITGRSEWEPQCENYDYHQEIARAAFADMLHDTERNHKYYNGLKIAINKVHQRGIKANVLDIGTGTGILSMMAVKCGADSVTACEAFRPMADCAEKIIEHNSMRGLINVIKKRSTDIVVGPEGDMKSKANILVTEVFDTELIGEGALGIFKHAHSVLLDKECIVVPDSATIYAHVVECPFAWSWNMPKIIANLEGDILLTTPTEISKCKGSAGIHDVQLNQFPLDKLNSIIKPTPVFHFDWSGKKKSPLQNTSSIKVKAIRTGCLQVVLMWWELKMDQIGEIVLSCAPYWAHPDFTELKSKNIRMIPPQNVIPWRDHWMQALYYLPAEVRVKENQELYLNFHHDEYSLWFDVTTTITSLTQPCQPLCDCGFHIAYSRTRIGQINDNIRNKRFLNILQKEIDSNSVVLSLSDGSLIGLAIIILGAKHVYCLEPNRYSYQVLQKYISTNKLKNVELIKSLDDIVNMKDITHVFGEPSFVTSIVPWDNFYFGTLLIQILDKLSKDVKIIPSKASIYAVPVEFLDLHKIRSPLGQCEDFDLNIFDQLIQGSSNLADSIIEAQPLWEYPCKALTLPKEILSIDFNNFLEKKNCSTEIIFEESATCNGIALWVDWRLDGTYNPKVTVTSGPCTSIEVGKFINWDIHSRQGVHLLPHPQNIQPSKIVLCKTTFLPDDGDIYFKFDFL